MKMFDADKTRVVGLPYGEKNNYNMLSRYHLIPERHWQADRQTVRQNCYINNFQYVLTRDKKAGLLTE